MIPATKIPRNGRAIGPVFFPRYASLNRKGRNGTRDMPLVQWVCECDVSEGDRFLFPGVFQAEQGLGGKA